MEEGGGGPRGLALGRLGGVGKGFAQFLSTGLRRRCLQKKFFSFPFRLPENHGPVSIHIGPCLNPSTVSLPDSITLGPHNITFSNSARNFGVILDSNLSTKKHLIKICKTAYSELEHISSVRRFLTEYAAKTLATSYILSRLDYCNCLIMGTPNSVIQPLQKIQNFAARFVLLAPRHHHSTPLLKKLHRLPISECIKYKVACMCFSALNSSGSAYLSELLHVCTPSFKAKLKIFLFSQYFRPK